MNELTLSLVFSLAALLCLAGFVVLIKRKLSQKSRMKQRLEFAINDSTQGLWDWDIKTNQTFSSPHWKHMLGYTDHEIGENPKDWDRLVHPDDKAHVYKVINQHLTGTAPHYESEYRIRCKDGSYLWVRDYGDIVDWDNKGRPLRMLGTTTDISKRKTAELANLEQLHLTQQFIENQSVATFMIDADHRVTHWNKAAVVLTGTKAEDMVGHNEAWRGFYDSPRPCLADLVLDNEKENAEEYYPKQGPSTLLNRTGWHAEAWFDNLGGKRRYVIFDAAPIFDTQGNVTAVIETLQDVTENKLIEQALTEEKLMTERVKKYLEDQKYALDQHSIVATTDVTGTITYANDKFCEISGYTHDELLGENHRILNSGYHSDDFFQEMYRTIVSGNVWHGEIRNKSKSGEFYWVDTTIVPFMNDKGKPQEYISIRTDITERKRAEDEANNLAYYDILTGLPNRRLFMAHLSQALAFSKRHNIYGAVLFIDLNKFKSLNDARGHDIGDLLLQQVGERLSAGFREIDTAARLGGDEFVVILNHLSSDLADAQTKADIVKQKISNALLQPYDLDGHEYQCSASIGISLLHSSEGNEAEILKKADTAMYEAKQLDHNKT